MKVELNPAGREFLIDGLAHLLAQVRIAVREEKKAFLPHSKSEKQVELVQEAGRTVPAASAKGDEWDIPGELLPVYRDALVMEGFKLEGLRKKEIELKVDPTKTKEKMDAVQAALKKLGDQRDLFAMIEEENRKQERASKPASDPAQLDALAGTGDGVDGKGHPPPKASDVTPIRPQA